MRKWLNKYFEMSRAEFSGLTVLWVLIVIFTLFPIIFSRVFPERSGSSAIMHTVKSRAAEAEKLTEWKAHRPESRRKPEGQLFNFDPNTLDAAGWQLLGLSAKQTAVILNYRNKGGKFRTPEDVSKMYTIKPSLYIRIAPYIHIESARIAAKSYLKLTPGIFKVIELNAADTLQLQEIVGIGPVFARRIVRYRERLGGFYSKTQLLEVFQLDSLKYAEIQAQASVDPESIRKIMVNRLMPGDLKDNPYLHYKQINAIIQYRKQHGNYSNIADLNKVVLLSPQILDKLEPYISFEP